MRDVYESLGEVGLQTFVSDGVPETARLEFKDLGWFGSRADREQRKHKLIARPLCAMANTHGGLIVFGVKTRSNNPDGIDRARELNPCASAEKFITVVSDLATSVVEPPLLGVEAALIPLAGGQFAAKVWVPESETKPHLVACAESEAHGHWQRSATGSFRMPQVAIESAYRTRLYREMSAAPLVTPIGKGGPEDVVCKHNQILIHVSNKGNAPAIGVTLSLESQSSAGAPHHWFTCRFINALAAGEAAPLDTNFAEDEMKNYKQFFEGATKHFMVIRFRDLAGTSYAVTVGLKERRNANKGKMEMSYTGDVSVERDGRRLI